MIAWLKRRNWWRIAFFVLLVIFEFTRELFVLEAAVGAVPGGSAEVFNYGDFTAARGQWARIDGQGRLMPSISTIECRREEGWCVEANTTLSGNYVFPPDLSRADAKFTQDAITYENDVPTCVTYSVRIDLKLEKVFAVRQRKAGDLPENCDAVEGRIEMQLGNPINDQDFEGHFLPILRVLRFAFS